MLNRGIRYNIGHTFSKVGQNWRYQFPNPCVTPFRVPGFLQVDQVVQAMGQVERVSLYQYLNRSLDPHCRLSASSLGRI
jgi:hypothetical protein